MRLQNRSTNDHGMLVLLELAVVPVAILATFLTLALAELGFAAVRLVISAMGAGETVVTVANVAIAVGTILVLVSGAGSLVVGYRHYFRSQFDAVSPLPVLLVPLLGVAVPIAYVIWTTGSLQLSWLFVPVAIAAYALAYRTIAIDSLREDRGQPSIIIGSLTGLPIVALLIDLGSRLLDPALPVAQTLDTIVTGSGIPTARPVIVAVPLLVTALYGVVTISDGQSRWLELEFETGAENKIGLPAVRQSQGERNAEAETGSGWSFSSLRTAVAERTARDWTGSFGRKLSGTDAVQLLSESVRSSDGSAAPASQQRSRTANAVVPSSPGSSPTDRGSARSGDDSRTTDASAAASKTGDDEARSGDTSADERDESASKRRAGAGTGPNSSTSSITDRITDDSSDGTSSGTDDTDDSADEPSTPDDEADDSSSEKVASDTRIFVDDFGQYGPDESADETPVETCPDCEQEIPSDGVYNFCPFCGGEL